MSSVSLCVIARDEERHLPECLQSAAGLFAEVVVVDTGSSDRTKEAAQRLGARVFDFAWSDSFAAARNESLRHARGEWVFWLDADDRLDPDNRRRLQLLFNDLPAGNVAYVMKPVSAGAWFVGDDGARSCAAVSQPSADSLAIPGTRTSVARHTPAGGRGAAERCLHSSCRLPGRGPARRQAGAQFAPAAARPGGTPR